MRFCFFICAFSLLTFNLHSDETSENIYTQRVGVRHIDPKGVGYSEGYTTLEGFFTAPNYIGDHWTPFLDLRTHFFNDAEFAANVGVGMRYLSSRIWGVGLYYDYRTTCLLDYNQIGAGFETLGKVCDFRLNGFLPVGKKSAKRPGAKFCSFEDHHMRISQTKEFAMKGMDAEVGVHIVKTKPASLYGAAGTYYLTNEGKHAWGGKGRIELTLGKHVTLGFQGSYDNLFKGIYQGKIGLQFPFGEKRNVKKAPWFPINQSVERSEIIIVGKKKCKSAAINPKTSEPYFFWFVDNTSSSNGTFESPFPDLASVEPVSVENDIVYVFPGDGTDKGLNAGFLLKNNQRLLGSAVSHEFNTTLGSVQTPILSSSAPVVSNRNNMNPNPKLGFAVGVMNNNEVSGFILNDLNINSCIASPLETVTNCKITNNSFNTMRNGIFLVPNIGMPGGTSGNINISSNRFVGVDGTTLNVRGIVLDILDGHADLSNNLFTIEKPADDFSNGFLLCKPPGEDSAFISLTKNRLNYPSTAGLFGTPIHLLNGSRGNLTVTLFGNVVRVSDGTDNPAGIEIEADLPSSGPPGITTAILHKNVSIMPDPVPGYLFQNTTGIPSSLVVDFGEDNIGTRKDFP